MAKMFINDSTLTAIADAIRAKTESTETMLPSEMAALIEGIETGGGITGKTESITSTQTLNLNVSLPTDQNFIFFAQNGTNTDAYRLVIFMLDGTELCTWMYFYNSGTNSWQSRLDAFTYDLSKGKITTTHPNFVFRYAYTWAYCGW